MKYATDRSKCVVTVEGGRSRSFDFPLGYSHSATAIGHTRRHEVDTRLGELPIFRNLISLQYGTLTLNCFSSFVTLMEIKRITVVLSKCRRFDQIFLVGQILASDNLI